jgi:SP family xylose:H+ symportor-like MFS transporter
MGISLAALGLAAFLQKTELWVLVFILGYIASFAVSMGPVVWVVLSEIFPTGVRGRAMAIATVTLWAANYVVAQTFPIINESLWLVDTFHHAAPFWLYAVFCIITIVFVSLFVPETKGKSLEEIEQMWRARSVALQSDAPRPVDR